MIPKMAARTWTGAPAEVFYNMYEDGEDFTSSMTQHIQSRFGEYDDPLEFDDMELYNIDEFAVEKAAYQQQFDFPVAGTPWGAPLSPEELDQVSTDYPGVIPGFDINSDEEILKEVYDLSDRASFNKVAADIDERIEADGLIGNEAEIYSNFGDVVSDPEQTGNLGIYTPMMINPILPAFDTWGDTVSYVFDGISNLGGSAADWLSNVGTTMALGQTMAEGGVYSDQAAMLQQQSDLNKDPMVQILDMIERQDDPQNFALYIGDPNLYLQDGGELNMDIVEQWIGKRAFFTTAEFGDLDWSSNDPVEISLTLQCDYWILEF